MEHNPKSLATRPVWRFVHGRSASGRPHIGEVLYDAPYSRAVGIDGIREVETEREATEASRSLDDDLVGVGITGDNTLVVDL